MLKDVVKELNLSHIRWWLESGSLLGAVRDGKICKGDTDIDIGMYFEDAWAIQTLNLEYVIHKRWQGKPSYWVARHGDLPINIICYYRIGDYRYYCEGDILQSKLPQDMNFTTVLFEGVKVKIPTIYKQMLDGYFSDWQTPSGQIGQTEVYKIKLDYMENKWEDQKPR